MDLRALGELQVTIAGQPVDAGPAKQRLVLFALLVNTRRPVPADTLIDRIWGETAPAGSRDILYTYIARLRRLLHLPRDKESMVTRRSGGYQLEFPPDRVDLHVFRESIRAAHQNNDPDERQEQRCRAIELWRGEPMAGLTGDWVAGVREALHQQYLGLVDDWAHAEIEAGRLGEAIDRLSATISQFPLAEPLVTHLIRALHRSDRRAEAVDLYARFRRRVVDELGVEPGTALRDLHARILRDTGGERQQRSTAPGSGCRLPSDLPDWIGQETELHAARAALAPTGTGALVLSGPAGVGKSAFAVHLGHLLSGDYPDGQVFVPLSARPHRPAEMYDQVLRSLGKNVTGDDHLDRYREAISGRRLLIVLDGAESAEGVRELVPGDPGSALIVTTRGRFATVPGRHLELAPFDVARSLALLRRIVGAARIDAEPAAACEIVDYCAGLPLALRIAGCRLAARPHWPVARLATRMAVEGGRLDELCTEGLSVRERLSLAYERLTPATRQLFHVLGLFPPAVFATGAVAKLAGVAPAEAEDLLEQLIDVRLVEPCHSGYRMNRLTHLYARQLHALAA